MGTNMKRSIRARLGIIELLLAPVLIIIGVIFALLYGDF